MKQLAAQGTVERSPRPSVLHVAWRLNIKVSTPHWAIYGLQLWAVEGALGDIFTYEGSGVGS